MSSPLLPPERMALTAARAQIKRGEDPTPNVAAVLIMALARLIDTLGDEPLYRLDNSEPEKTYSEDTIGAFIHTTLGYVRTGVLVRVWPEKNTSDGLSTTDEQ